MKKPRIQAADVLAAMVRGPAGRSSLYLWMRENYADLLAGFQRDRPDWTALSETLGRAGLTDRTGKPPKPETARKTWQTVRKDMAKRQPAQQAAPDPASAERLKPSPESPLHGRASYSPVMRPADSLDDEDSPEPPKFKFFKPR